MKGPEILRTDPPAWSRRDAIAVATIVAAALLVRGLYLLELSRSVYFDHLVLNAADYDRWARLGYPRDQPYYQAPLYIYFLKAVYALASEEHRLFTARVVQALLGTGTAVIAFFVARRWIGTWGGFAAGLACGLARPLVYFDAEILPTPLETFLLLASLALFARSMDLRRRRAPSRLEWAAAGLLLGLAATCRPNFLVVAPVFAALVFATGAATMGRRAAGSAALYLLGALLPVSLVAARNTSAGHGFVLLTANAGPNLLLGNNPQADGLSPFLPDAVTRWRRDLVQSDVDQVALARASSAEARRYMSANPGRTAGLVFKKALLFFNRWEIPNNRSIRQQIGASRTLRWPPAAWIGAGLLLPLALAGFAACGWPYGSRGALGLGLCAAVVTYLPFIVCARFRAPFLPWLAIAAGVAIARSAHRPSRREAVRMAAAAILGIAIAWPNWYAVRDTEFPQLARNHAYTLSEVARQDAAQGRTIQAMGKLRLARTTLEESVAEHPQSAFARSTLAGFLSLQGDFDGARRYYEEALDLDETHAPAHLGLGGLAAAGGDPAGAEVHLRRALDLDPGHPDYALGLGDALYWQARYREAIEMYERATRLSHRVDDSGVVVPATGTPQTRHAQLQIGVARAFLSEAHGDLASAEFALRTASTLAPDNIVYRVELARFLHRHGRSQEASSLLDECLARPGLGGAERRSLQELAREFEVSR